MEKFQPLVTSSLPMASISIIFLFLLDETGQLYGFSWKLFFFGQCARLRVYIMFVCIWMWFCLQLRHCLNSYWRCHIWLLHIECVLMRDDMSPFHLKQNRRYNFSLLTLIFVCCQFFYSSAYFSSSFSFWVWVVLYVVWCDAMTKPFESCSYTNWMVFRRYNDMFKQAYLLGFPILHRMSFDQSQTIFSSFSLEKYDMLCVDSFSILTIFHYRRCRIFVVSYCLSTNI